ncbi:MAG: D-alanyl-D-alanine carboxypeptidase [Candidatus Krumholzibacteria bacterium]|nr:D-alanyl-D-alanine carboxypeptidase [Candidatus Krumholzibacteria bacterium]
MHARTTLFSWLLRLAIIALGCLVPAVVAATASADNADAADRAELPLLDGDFAASIIMDARTGEIIAGKNIDLRRHPASMVKMMTQLLIIERVDEGDIALADPVTVSARASRMGGSQVWLKHREQFSVEDLLAALTIHSANDAAVALAEHVAGSVEAFIDLMNHRAVELGLTGTEFHSVHGLPPSRGQQPDLSTARDMALLGRALLEHPTILHWSSQATAPFRGGEFTLYNPNRLIGTYRGLDGLKTGYTGPAGYCVTATAVQKGVRLISVVMGCPTDQGRATETTRLLSYGFNLYAPVDVFAAAGEPVALTLAVQGGKDRSVGLVVGQALAVTVRRDQHDAIEVRHEVPSAVEAPIAAGQKLGEAVVVMAGHELGRVDLLAAAAVEKGAWFQRLLR